MNPTTTANKNKGQSNPTTGSQDMDREHKGEGTSGVVGGGMQKLAGAIREHGPSSGMVGAATEAVAEKIEKGGEYLSDKGFEGITQDMTALIRNNPVPAFLVAMGIGFMLAKMTRS